MRISDWSSDVCASDLQQGATELISGIGGIYIADRIAGRLFRPGSLVMSGIRQLPGVRAVAAMDKQYQLTLRAAQIGMRQAESRGEMGSAAFNSVMNFKSLGVQFNTALGAARKAVTRSSNRKSTRLNSSHSCASHMPSSARLK